MTPERSPECRSSLLSPLGAVTTTTAASAAAVSLPNDLVFDILSKLQVKPLCRFRCVSRGWRALISDPVFATMHKSRHADADPLIVVSFSKENPWSLYRALRLMDMDGNVVKVIEGKGSIGLHFTSVDSLVCVVANVFSGLAHVVDLATGEALLDCPESKDLSYRQCVFGFGRSAPSGLYKPGPPMGLSNWLRGLTVGEDTEWRTAQSSPVYISAYRSSPVAVNGNIYFLISFDYRLLLACFDLESEQWKEPLQGPKNTESPEIWRRTRKVYISELRGSLCVLQFLDTQSMTVWLMMESNKDKWIKMYTIPVAPSAHYSSSRILWVTHDGGKLIVDSLLNQQEPVLQVYDTNYKTCKRLLKLDCGPGVVGLCSLQLNGFVSTKI
ncbi:hypothetical protein QYE76_019800 [Lolium multiflorum]|uniref:F-box domain-containing protein n=1 Tax=Lolium multiflorum TaxID=4521 RepID=A0AAD8VRI8_LOLMU|nr:hypothetical protein QYE76_019800 [Lolium multiflorum]